MHDVGDVFFLIATIFEHGGDAGEVGDGIEIFGGLFGAVAAVEVCTDAAVEGVAGELADVVDEIADDFEFEATSCGVVWPRIQPGIIIQASRAAPMTPPRSMRALS